MKINILYRFRDSPWGGGNQFLKGLKKKFIERNVYEENPYSADVILFNSYPSGSEYLFNKIFKLKKGGKTIVQRVDGPIYFVRGNDIQIDRIIYYFNQYFADGTIFQSEWSKQKCYETGMRGKYYEAIIMNSPDPTIFYRSEKIHNHTERKIKLIATSWSANKKKGFDVYEYLDRNLDFNKYAMTFIGNSPIHFKNIRHIQPLSSLEVADKLREHDIFITASLDDPCSNSLLEALHCGLPAVARNSGGHPAIIGKSGEIFNGRDDVLNAIEMVACNIGIYRKYIYVPSIEQVADSYYEFFKNIYSTNETNRNISKGLCIRYLEIMRKVFCWRFKNVLKNKLLRDY
jgi:glycosyltransferase involved in cell wall biosynthesis